MRQRKKLQFKELEEGLEQVVALHQELLEEFKAATGRPFHSEGTLLYRAVVEFRAEKRGGVRTNYCVSDDDRLVLLSSSPSIASNSLRFLKQWLLAFVQAATGS
jgi:hypothetical protein